MDKIWKFWTQCDRRAFAHIYTYRAAHCGKDVGLYFHFIQLFPDNNTNICRTVPQQGGPVWWIPTTYSKLQRPLYGCKITGWFLECVKKGKLLDFDNGGLFLFSATFLTRFAQPHPKNLWNCMMSNCVLSGFR